MLTVMCYIFTENFVLGGQVFPVMSSSNRHGKKRIASQVDLFLHSPKILLKQTLFVSSLIVFEGFPTRMVYPHYISCLRYTILVGNPRFVCLCCGAGDTLLSFAFSCLFLSSFFFYVLLFSSICTSYRSV